MSDISKPLPSLRAVAERLAEARAAVGLIAFVVVFALLVFVIETLSLLGVPDRILVWMVAVFALVLPPLVAISTRTVSLTEFAVASRTLGPAEDAMAASIGMFGGVFAIGLAAAFFRGEAQSSALALGLCGGLLLGGVLIAPYLRRAARQSLGDFLAVRFGRRAISALAGVVVVAALAPMLVAELSLAAMVGNWTLGISKEAFMIIAVILALVPPLVGGMRAVTFAGALQFLILFTALAFASIWISQSATGQLLPLAGYVTAAGELQASGILNAAASAARDWAGLGLCVVFGIAVLPSILMRSAAVRSAQSVRGSTVRTLFLVALFAMASVSIAAIAKWTIYDYPNRFGTIAELVSQPWVVSWVAHGEGLVTLCGEPASEAGVSCPAGALTPGELAISPDIALLAAPGVAGIPPLAGMLLATGCLVASIAAGSLLLQGISRALGHDLLFRGLMPRMPASRRLLVQRLALLIVAVVAAEIALAPPAGYLRLALTGLALAASGLFPALLLGIWWQRANHAGALLGMLAGFAIATYLAAATIYDPGLFAWLEPVGLAELARSLGAEKATLVAVPVGLIVAMLTSLATRAPGAEQRALAAALFTPRDLPADDETE